MKKTAHPIAVAELEARRYAIGDGARADLLRVLALVDADADRFWSASFARAAIERLTAGDGDGLDLMFAARVYELAGEPEGGRVLRADCLQRASA